MELAGALNAQLDYLNNDGTVSAVDNELALLWWNYYSRSKWQGNPLNYRNPGPHPRTLMVMRLDGPQQTLIGAAIYEPAADRTWFVKALGPPAVIDLHEQEVFQFSRSFGAGASDAEANE